MADTLPEEFLTLRCQRLYQGVEGLNELLHPLVL